MKYCTCHELARDLFSIKGKWFCSNCDKPFIRYCTCKHIENYASIVGNKPNQWCCLCDKAIRTNKQIKASKQAKGQLRDNRGRFKKVGLTARKLNEIVGEVLSEINEESSITKKQFYNASKKPCREQMDILINHENRLKQLEKGDSKKRNYQTILIRLDRIEKLLVDIDEKITRAFGGGGGGGVGFNY